MGEAVLTTLFGGNLTLSDSFGKLAAPRLASASETSRETLVPMMDMLPTRGDWHKPHLGLAFYFCGFFHECAIVDSANPVSVAPSAVQFWTANPSRLRHHHYRNEGLWRLQLLGGTQTRCTPQADV